MEIFAAPRVLIVGAGSMGLIVGYHLSLARTDVTFLVRPGSFKRLDRPQVLYCYDDNSLKQFDRYAVISDHGAIAGGRYDYIVITLDGASMQNEAGIELTKAIGKAAQGTDTKVILGSVFFDSRRWFQSMSGLPEEQFANGFLRSTPTRQVPSPSRSTSRPIRTCLPRRIWLTPIAWATA